MSYDGPHIAHALPTKLSVLLRRCCRAAVGRVRALAFWLAVGLPWLLLAFTIGGFVASNPDVFAGLFGVTVLCALAGQDHGR